jgi:anti-sigma factor RsiW
MATGSDRWQQLNAYVDGELDPQAQAEVAAAIARDRELATAAATLTRLKAATGHAYADAPRMRIAPEPTRPSRRRAAGLATVAATAAAAAALWFVSASPLPADLDLAVSRHAAFVASDAPPPAGPLASPLLVGLARLDRPVELPDLRDSGLQVIRIAALDQGGLHVSYLGSRGCRVSLLVTKAASGPPSLRTQIGTTEVARWTADELAYTLLASGMPKERFALIAANAEDSVRQRRPLPEPMREALRRERDGSAPCVG